MRAVQRRNAQCAAAAAPLVAAPRAPGAQPPRSPPASAPDSRHPSPLHSSPPPRPPQRYVGIDQRAPPPPRGPGFEYRYLTEFQSHEPEFDYLKSLEIEEKINKVRWVRSGGSTKHVISTNDKTVKLWKVYEKRVTSITGFNVLDRSRWGRGRAAAAPRRLRSGGQQPRAPRTGQRTARERCAPCGRRPRARWAR
jgi:hypothetical protein